MNRIYHGCMWKNADGTKWLTVAGGKCLVSTAKPYWKYPKDLPTPKVNSRTQYNKQPLVTHRVFNTYFRNKVKKDIERWETVPDSEVYVSKPLDRF